LEQLHDWILSETTNRICPMRRFLTRKNLFGYLGCKTHLTGIGTSQKLFQKFFDKGNIFGILFLGS
jgi:hypothetical protein